MRRKRNYIVYTLDAREIMKLRGRKYSRIDLNNTYDREKVLAEENRFAESALFYQIVRAASTNGDERNPREIITKSLVYLDFKRDISDVAEETISLLTEGFEIRFRGEEEYTRFVPFDKSASMSRECTISFISDALFNEVDVALDMGFRSSQDHYASKYYAYRGLFMTDGWAVDSDRMPLNERTVVIIKTRRISLKGTVGITVLASKNKNGQIDVNQDACKTVEEIEITPYDGEGFISPEYAACINRGNTHREAATSFQIRMPYCKGMLHSVNFKRFFTDQFSNIDIDTLEITDYFGIKRSLKDVQIILTDSMFKCAKWLENMFAGVTDDPMKYYFKQFEKYNHALYVANTNVGIRATKQIKMNYQFLNTLCLDKESFDRIMGEHLNGVRNILNDPNIGREALLNEGDYFDDNIDSERVKHMDAWEYALRINERFVTDPMIKTRLEQAARGEMQDVLRGRVNVKGCIKYLSGDLLGLLIKIARNCGIEDEKQIKELENEMLLPDRFYTSGITSGISGVFSPNKYYGMLRSPHLSRNEQCALRPYTSNIYAKYFRKLKGVVMVSDSSDVPAAMSGADFDGDMVKIVINDDINDAILKTVYEVDKEAGIDSHGIIRYKRVLPIPIISAPKGGKKPLNKYISYEDLSSAFSSRVGHISNLAIKIAKLECSGVETVPPNSAALCTIATGLEIDSVKNGSSPDITYLENLCKNVDDTYLRIHNKMKNETDPDRKIHVEYDENADKFRASHKYRKALQKDKELFSISGNQDFNIDYLPYFYAKSLSEGVAKGVLSLECESLPDYCFTFELYENWRTNAANDPRTQKLREIIGAYRKLRADSWNIGRAESLYSEGSLRGKINTILDVEYEAGIDRLYRSGEYIESALETAYQSMYEIIKDEAFADESIKLMVDLNWQYTSTFESKVDLLKEIIGTADLPMPALEMLCDTYDNGYQILNHILRDIKQLRKVGELQLVSEEKSNEDNDEIPRVGIRSPWRKEYDKELFRKLFEEFQSYYTRSDYTKTDWLKEAGVMCREEVLKLFSGDIDRAIECTVALDKEIDDKHAFLWGVFETQDFSHVIYDKHNKRSLNVK